MTLDEAQAITEALRARTTELELGSHDVFPTPEEAARIIVHAATRVIHGHVFQPA